MPVIILMLTCGCRVVMCVLVHTDVNIHWHPQGDYLAVKVDRFTKTKKSTFTGFELFSIRERDIPMEVLELSNKSERIISFAWEPKGHRFAIVHGEGSRPNVSFYTMKDDKGRLGVKLLGKLACFLLLDSKQVPCDSCLPYHTADCVWVCALFG